jgi:hypothetical protein
VNQMYRRANMKNPAAVWVWIHRSTLRRLSFLPRVSVVARTRPTRWQAHAKGLVL